MKKIDRKLLGNYEISEKEKLEFLKFATENIKLEKIGKFLKWLITGKAIILNMILMLISILLLPTILGIVVVRTGNVLLGFSSTLPVIIFGVLFSTFFIIGILQRRTVTSNSVRKISFLELSKKWFSFYGVKKEKVYSVKFNDCLKYVDKYRMVSKDTIIDHEPEVICVELNNLKIHLVNVRWAQVKSIVDKNGVPHQIDDFINQFYVITTNLNETWSDFYLELYKSASNKKSKTLENASFNNMYYYKYNDAIKLRKLLTPAVQELLVEKASLDNLKYYLDNGVFISTIKAKDVGNDFSPLEINLNLTGFSSEAIKKRVEADVLSDYLGIMDVLSHNQIFYQLHKK